MEGINRFILLFTVLTVLFDICAAWFFPGVSYAYLKRPNNIHKKIKQLFTVSPKESYPDPRS